MGSNPAANSNPLLFFFFLMVIETAPASNAQAGQSRVWPNPMGRCATMRASPPTGLSCTFKIEQSLANCDSKNCRFFFLYTNQCKYIVQKRIIKDLSILKTDHRAKTSTGCALIPLLDKINTQINAQKSHRLLHTSFAAECITITRI